METLAQVLIIVGGLAAVFAVLAGMEELCELIETWMERRRG